MLNLCKVAIKEGSWTWECFRIMYSVTISKLYGVYFKWTSS